MKKITLVWLFALVSFLSFGQEVEIIRHDFQDEVVPEGWEFLFERDDSCDWEFGQIVPFGDIFPTTALFFNDDECGQQTPSTIAIAATRQYDLSEATSATLTVDIGYDRVLPERQAFRVFVWDEILDESVALLAEFLEDIEPQHQTFVFDITEYASATTSFRFIYDDSPFYPAFNGSNNFNWGSYGGIDNFILSAEGVDPEEVLEVLSLDDNSSIEGFQMFPNPTSNELTISASRNIEGVTVFNMLGQNVLEQNLSATSGTINVSSLETGAYLLQVTADGQTEAYKFVKQ